MKAETKALTASKPEPHAKTEQKSGTRPQPTTKQTPPPPTGATTLPPTGAAPSPSTDGHMSDAQLLSYLESLGIQAETVHHPAVFTVEAMMPHLKHVSGAATKNLFLKDKKKVLYVLSARHDVEFKLADVAKKLPGAKELRFGDEGVMFDLLGVKQGCVTAFALVNDREGKVKFLVDEKLVDGSFEKVWFHPLTNEATTGVSVADFKRFLSATGHEPTVVQL